MRYIAMLLARERPVSTSGAMLLGRGGARRVPGADRVGEEGEGAEHVLCQPPALHPGVHARVRHCS
eukprot:3173415-Rhodomonas_salina.1